MICDCHIHLYEDHYPLAANATFKPPVAPLAAYQQVQAELGLRRVVIVQPTGYGFDNTCTLDGLRRLGKTHARAVVVVEPSISDAQLEALDAQGVCGIRFMLVPGAGGVLGWDAVAAFGPRLAALNWCANLQIDGRDFPRYQAIIEALPCKVVIDHTGKFLEPVAVDSPAFQALMQIMAQPQRWIKLAAPYETSKIGPPLYDDVSLLAQTLAAHFPDQCLWASNWPHPNRNPLPSNQAMLDLVKHWAPDAAVQQKILVTNPASLYAF